MWLRGFGPSTTRSSIFAVVVIRRILNKVDDGREFRYIFYGVDTGSAVYVITLETTYSDTSQIDFDELDEIFKDMIESFK